MRLIDRIRPVLGFKAESIPVFIDRAVLALFASKPVGRIKLNAGPVCIDL